MVDHFYKIKTYHDKQKILLTMYGVEVKWDWYFVSSTLLTRISLISQKNYIVSSNQILGPDLGQKIKDLVSCVFQTSTRDQDPQDNDRHVGT